MSAGHSHGGSTGTSSTRRLSVALVLVVGYMIAEVVGGLLSNSLALLADAGHMLSDAGALLVALLATRIASRPASATHTFGYHRAEVLGALANSAALLAIAGYVAFQAVTRIGSPPQIHGPLMLAVAAGGLAMNITGLFILHKGKNESLNMRGAWLHVVTDTLGSVGAITSGILVTILGWNWADPVASLIIAALVLYSGWLLLRQTTSVLMQTVPEGIDIATVERALASATGVLSVHDLHVWSMTHGRPVLSAHISVEPDVDRQRLMEELNELLRTDFDVHHSTLQLGCPAECEPCEANH